MAANAPLALRAINRTLRAGLAERVRQATRLEAAEQARLGRHRFWVQTPLGVPDPQSFVVYEAAETAD